jgi:hypothetical protein
MTSDHITATTTLEATAAFNTIIAFVIPLVVMLLSMPLVWQEKHLWNFSILQRVYLSNLVMIMMSLIPMRERKLRSEQSSSESVLDNLADDDNNNTGVGDI